MKRLFEIGLFCLRATVVSGVILALVVSGAGAAHRLFAERSQPRADEPLSNSASFSGKPDPLEATGGMTPGSHPWTEQSFWIQCNSALPAGGDQHKGRSLASQATSSTVSKDSRIQNEPAVCNTPCLVASQVGHRFTLVGARPSGTS
ncbi:MAG: hypothetical protein AB1772_03115 [Candidatus Zixiibacteriota bacterium]